MVGSVNGYAFGGYVTDMETNTGHLMCAVNILENYGKPMNWTFDRRAGIYGEKRVQIRDLMQSIEVNIQTSSNIFKPKC